MTALGRDSGIQAVGQVPLGTHFCQFYRTKRDLIDTLVPYFTAGLRSNELCLWVTSDPLRAVEATALMHEAMPDFEDFLSRGQIEILDYEDWYLRTGGQDGCDTLKMWVDWERRALAAGYEGLRLTGNTFWLDKSGWDEFMTYEEAVNQTFAEGRIIGLCTYSLDRCGAEDVLDVCRTHQFALARRRGEWELIESSSLKIAKSELERRVADRTAELQTALQGRDEFLAMLAHELRNPLAPIRNAAQVIQLLGSTDTHLSWARDVIDRQVRQLARLVDDLLDVSRVTRGKVELHREEIDVAAVIAQAVETSRPLIDSRKHNLLLVLPPEPVRLHADLTRLAQVISNLLNNAAKYMNEGGRIWLAVERHGSEVWIRVKDEGIGIPPEMLSRVFDLFTQVHQSLDRSEGGLGIGLALVRSLVELHGGSVEAWSEGPERGTELVVRLPVVGMERVAGTGSRESAVAAKPGAGRKILVVDDNHDAAETLGKILEISGHEVFLAHDGEEALAQAGRHRPEVLLLDIGLPKVDGYEVARRLRLDPGNEGLLLIAVTGYGNREDRERGQLSGFDHHLVKPIDLQQLQGLLASRRRAEATH